jgi:hypothetical protein
MEQELPNPSGAPEFTSVFRGVCVAQSSDFYVGFCMPFVSQVRATTPSYMIYGELGCYPLSIKIKLRMISFWNRLISNENKLSSKLYKLMYKLHMNGTTNFKWISFVQSVFNDTGLSYVFESQFPICMSSIKSAIKQRLCDQFIQNWFSDLDNSAREFYKVVKKNILNLKSTLLDYQSKTGYT